MKNNNIDLLIHLISNNYSISEIADILKVPYKKIYEYLNVLKEKGYEVLSKYYYNGNTSYQLSNQLFENYEPIIITSKDDKDIELLVYSDLHFGSFFENNKYLKMVYDYSKSKNIHIHLNVGDIIEGDVAFYNTKLDINKQIDHALKVHPHSDDILVFLLLGNHDYNLLEGYGINVGEVIKRKRKDIIPIGYKEGVIKVKNDYIVLQHPILNLDIGTKGIYNHALIIRGHGHAARVVIDTSNITLYTPSLSDLNLRNSQHPGFLHLTLKMHFGLIENIELKELIISDNKVCVVNELEIFAGRGKKIREKNVIINEEDYPKVLTKGRI